MPNSKHLTHVISNLVSLITKTKLGLSTASGAGWALGGGGCVGRGFGAGAQARGDVGMAGGRSPIALVQPT
jgi:hypothetical protein